jgi:hypothetical protein
MVRACGSSCMQANKKLSESCLLLQFVEVLVLCSTTVIVSGLMCEAVTMRAMSPIL